MERRRQDGFQAPEHPPGNSSSSLGRRGVYVVLGDAREVHATRPAGRLRSEPCVETHASPQLLCTSSLCQLIHFEVFCSNVYFRPFQQLALTASFCSDVTFASSVGGSHS